MDPTIVVAGTSAVSSKDVLELCFAMGATVFGVFGFLYSIFVSAASGVASPPPAVYALRNFSRVTAAVLLIITTLIAILSIELKVPWSAWVLLTCFTFLTVGALYIAFRKMNLPRLNKHYANTSK